MSIDSDLFRSVLGRFASGITIVTTHDGEGRDHGMTVSAFASVSLDPTLVLVAIGNDATMSPVMADANTFAVNILRADQEELSRRFSGKLDDRFAGIRYEKGMHGDAVLTDALASLQCRVVSRHPAGDHVLVIGEVEAADARDGEPLLYYRSGYAGIQR